jgi:hypothetical protein
MDHLHLILSIIIMHIKHIMHIMDIITMGITIMDPTTIMDTMTTIMTTIMVTIIIDNFILYDATISVNVMILLGHSYDII